MSTELTSADLFETLNYLALMVYGQLQRTRAAEP